MNPVVISNSEGDSPAASKLPSASAPTIDTPSVGIHRIRTS
jgi:hypothetical protein